MTRVALLLFTLMACAPAAAPPAAVVDVKPVASSRVGTVAEIDAGPRPTTLPPIETADRLAAEGRAYAARGELAAALNRFETAYRISPSDDVLYEIGRTLELMGRRREAAEVYEKSLQGDLSHMDRMSLELRIQQLRTAP
jgi:tetratricopeptide (TPR) repeat protein